eukprot:CAMPEP_0114119844 /NCGR_PEP_ID=MMETSP0043_2-20121206/6327_1 /TAXON_ID=464988 /ORGANISM="Hemiselmis andersenii, Strain CCMP644" /LENGTH=72 /DNA_ID=CAMNT_0001212417 /DNA_START=20 /DNA_END=235 /DNA_ORIENTATION=-
MRLFKLMKGSLLFEVPGENRDNGKNENHNPLDDISSDLFVWHQNVPRLDFGEPDYEAFADTCPSQGPDGGEW